MGFREDAGQGGDIEVESKARDNILFLNVSSPMMESSYALVGKDSVRQLRFTHEMKED